MHFLPALLMAWTALGMTNDDVDLPPKIPTPNGAGTPSEELGGVNPTELLDQVADALQDQTTEHLNTVLRDYEPQTSVVQALESDFKTIFDEFTTPQNKLERFTWSEWLTRMIAGRLKESTSNLLLKSLINMANTGEYTRESLQQTSLNFILSRVLEQDKLVWPTDLNVLQDFTDYYNYGSLHTMELTLGPNLWKDSDYPRVIGDRLVHYIPNLKTYSAPVKLLEALLGPQQDWWKFPAHELHLWKRLGGCESARTKLQELLDKVPLYNTLYKQQYVDETTTLRLHAQSQTLTKTWFYFACPLSVLIRSLNHGMTSLRRDGLDTSRDDFATSTFEFKTAMNTGTDWIPKDENINLHFTARGALMMALYLLSRLPRGKREYFKGERLVLMRFRLPLRWILTGYAEKTLRLWNRLYFEHSLASTAALYFDVASLATMQVYEYFHFHNTRLCNNWTPSWTVKQLSTYMEMYWSTCGEKNYYQCGHLTLPIPLKDLLDEDSKKTKTRKRTVTATEEDTPLAGLD